MERVYPSNRTWHNWLRVEWIFRNWTNKYIIFDHDVQSHFNNYIALTVEPNFAYKNYLKFNTSNNNRSKSQTIKEIDEYNKIVDGMKNTTIVDAEILFRDELDKELYNECINEFELDDNYSYANEIHKQWYTLHKNAEVDIVRDITNMYKTINT